MSWNLFPIFQNQPNLLITKKVKLEDAVQDGFLELLSKEKRVVKILIEI